MTVYMQLALVARSREHHTYYPDGAEDVVGMGVGYVEMVQAVDGYAGTAQLGEYAVAAAGIDQQLGGIGMQYKTGVVTAGNSGMPRPQNGYLVHSGVY